MSYFLFAGSHYYPVGGANDLVGTFSELSDEIVLATVLQALREDRIEYYHHLWANALSIAPETLGARRYWEVRIAEQPNNPDLRFCSIKQEIEGLGWCGIMPMCIDATDGESPFGEVSRYPLLDPEKRCIR